MASADLLHSPKVHLALGSARDSFDEDTWNHHIGQVRTGQVRASPEFSDGCTTADAAPTTEEIRYASGGYGGRRNVDWNANHFSEVGMSGLGPQSPQPDPHAASMSASFGAAGIGGVDDGGRWPTLTNWSARKDTHMGVTTFGGSSDTDNIDDWRHPPPSARHFEMVAASKRESALAYLRVKTSSRGTYSHEPVESSWEHRPTIRVSPQKSNVSSFHFQFDAHDLGPTDKAGSPRENRPHAGCTSRSTFSFSHEAHPSPPPSSRAFSGRASQQSHQFDDSAVLSPPLRELANGKLAVGHQSAPTVHGSRSSVQRDIRWDDKWSQLAVNTDHQFRASSQFARPKADLDAAGAAATRYTSVVYALPHDSASLQDPESASDRVGKRMIPGAPGLAVHVPDTWRGNLPPESMISLKAKGTGFRQDSPGMLTEEGAAHRNAPPPRRPTEVGQAIEWVASPPRRQPVPCVTSRADQAISCRSPDAGRMQPSPVNLNFSLGPHGGFGRR